MSDAYAYIKRAQGLLKSQNYPYVAKKNTCSKPSNSQIGCTVSNWVWLTSGDEEGMKRELYFKGPIATSIDVPQSFYNYKSGIFSDPACKSNSVSHGVTIVGYGTENGRDYWLVKNSWGAKWGDNGYCKIARNANNHCGISSYPLYPIV